MARISAQVAAAAALGSMRVGPIRRSEMTATVSLSGAWRMTRTPAGANTGIALARERRGAARFFWTWLIVATSMSVTGNVAHAVLQAPAGAVVLAAGAALVPPVVLLAATHSVALLVRTRAGGLTYWCALAMTLALAACAFVLSFDALRSLAISLGLPDSIAWLWPCAIDVAIAQATLCLLSLSRRGGSAGAAATVSGGGSAPIAKVRQNREAPPIAVPDPDGERRDRMSLATRARSEQATTVLEDPPAAIRRWMTVAESIVQEGVTSKDPALVATILAQREAGMPPSTIGRTFKVHHTTVGRILSAVDELTA
jgi:hypothetical protein